jgi:hypothetical protein
VFLTKGLFMTLSKELTLLRYLIQQCQIYPGAAWRARAIFFKLDDRLARAPRQFSGRQARTMQELRCRLPEYVDVIDCPSCQGSGCQGRFSTYTHPCSRCGGHRKVVDTPEVRREQALIWSRSGSAAA